MLKDLQSQQIVQIGSDHGYSGPASWSDSGRNLVYLYTDHNVCELRRMNVIGMKPAQHEVIHRCPENSYGKIIFSHDENRVIYAETSKAGPPYSIFELDTVNSKTRRLRQPDRFLAGNTQFDLHPVRNELLISSPNEAQWLEIYRLNLETDELSLLFSLDEYVCCAIWSTTGDRVVMIGEHPAYELISYDLKGRDRTVIYDAPHRISSPARFGKQQAYVYVGGIYNRDIVSYEIGGPLKSVIVDSSVDDRLATVSPDGFYLAYVSDRSGYDDIWVHHLESSGNTRIGSTIGSKHYFDLQ